MSTPISTAFGIEIPSNIKITPNSNLDNVICELATEIINILDELKFGVTDSAIKINGINYNPGNNLSVTQIPGLIYDFNKIYNTITKNFSLDIIYEDAKRNSKNYYSEFFFLSVLFQTLDLYERDSFGSDIINNDKVSCEKILDTINTSMYVIGGLEQQE